MVITRTPYRVSFFGGGTDYERWYSQYGGAVLTCTIAKYCHVLLRKMPPFLGTKYRIFWSQSESVDRIEDIQHSGVMGCLQYLEVEDGIEINHAGDLPARSGIGSSSAFTVGMLNALHVLRGEHLERAELANEAIAVEQRILKETVGIQDQIECAWGGLNYIKIDHDGTYQVKPILLDRERRKLFEDHLILVFTDLQRYASEIAREQVDNIDRKREELQTIMNLVPVAVDILKEGTPKDFGELLHRSWMLKKKLSDKIANPIIDNIYDVAIKSGAYGGKLLGAGGGGFFLFVVPPEKHRTVIESIGLISVPFKFDTKGSHVVLAE